MEPTRTKPATAEEVRNVCALYMEGISFVRIHAKTGMPLRKIESIVYNRIGREHPRPEGMRLRHGPRTSKPTRQLSEHDVELCLRLYHDDILTLRDIEAALECSRGAVRAFLEGRTFKEIPRPPGFRYPRENYYHFRPLSRRVRKKPKEILELARQKYPLEEVDLLSGRLTRAVRMMWSQE